MLACSINRWQRHLNGPTLTFVCRRRMEAGNPWPRVCIFHREERQKPTTHTWITLLIHGPWNKSNNQIERERQPETRIVTRVMSPIQKCSALKVRVILCIRDKRVTVGGHRHPHGNECQFDLVACTSAMSLLASCHWPISFSRRPRPQSALCALNRSDLKP